MSIVGEVALVRSFPRNGSPGSTADLTPKDGALSGVTRYIAQRYEKLRGNWRNTKKNF